ncbi:unnamed protein product, partial [Rotaria sordida]
MSENLESFSLLWLDRSVNASQENIAAQSKLRAIINHLKTFEKAEECEKYIRKCPETDRIVLIVSGGLGQQIVPQIDQLPQLSSIYVYCMDEKKNREWSKNHPKVKHVLASLPKLIHQIESDQIRKDNTEESSPISVSETNKPTDRSSIGLTSRYVYSRLLIEELIRMKPKSEDKEKFISLCEKQYQGNETQLKYLKEFQDKYTPDNAIRWYTKKSFVYRILNKALRVQNVQLLYLFRFFIRDICHQLEKYQCSTPVTVYRVQSISHDELQGLKRSIGKLIAMTSFVSTSLDQERALKFRDNNSDLPQVCFEIYADPKVESIKPFANITSLSKYKKEQEILFMLGSIFQLLDVREEKFQDQKPIWMVRMTLCSDNNHSVKTSFQEMKNEIFGDNHEPNKFSFGILLEKMHKLEDAEMYYLSLLDELDPNHSDILQCYFILGSLAWKRGD